MLFEKCIVCSDESYAHSYHFLCSNNKSLDDEVVGRCSSSESHPS